MLCVIMFFVFLCCKNRFFISESDIRFRNFNHFISCLEKDFAKNKLILKNYKGS